MVGLGGRGPRQRVYYDQHAGSVDKWVVERRAGAEAEPLAEHRRLSAWFPADLLRVQGTAFDVLPEHERPFIVGE